MNVSKVIETLRKSDLDKNTQLKIINSIINPSQEENKELKQFKDRYEIKPNSSSSNSKDGQFNNQQFEILKNKLDMIQTEMADMMVHFKDYAQRYLTAMRQSDMDKLLSYVEELTEANKSLKEAQEVMSEEEKKLEAQQEEESKGFFSRATEGVTNLLSGVKGGVQSLTGFVASTSQMANSALSTPIFQKNNTNTQTTSNIAPMSNIATLPKSNLISLEDYQSAKYGFQPINNTINNINTTNKTDSIENSNTNIIASSNSNISSMVLSNVVIPTTPSVMSMPAISTNSSNIIVNASPSTNLTSNSTSNILVNTETNSNVSSNNAETKVDNEVKPNTPQGKVNLASQKLTTQIKKTENKPMVGGGYSGENRKITRHSMKKNVNIRKHKSKKGKKL